MNNEDKRKSIQNIMDSSVISDDEEILEATITPVRLNSLSEVSDDSPRNLGAIPKFNAFDNSNKTNFNSSFTNRREISSLLSSDEEDSIDDGPKRDVRFSSHYVSESPSTSTFESCSSVSRSITSPNLISSESDSDDSKNSNKTLDHISSDATEGLLSPKPSDNSSDSGPFVKNRNKVKRKQLLISSDESSDEIMKVSPPSRQRQRASSTDSTDDREVNNEEKTNSVNLPAETISLLSDEEEDHLQEGAPALLKDDDIVDVNDIMKPLILNKESNMEAARKRLELEVMDVENHLENMKIVHASLKQESINLPDKGNRMRRSIEKKSLELQKLNDRISFIDKQLKTAPGPDTKPKLPYMNDLPTASMNLSELGKKALETHNVQRVLTMETLQKLHESLEKQPTDFSVEPKSGLKVTLLPHQKYGLGWTLWREAQKPAGGILADDMGLGKTLTMISLILHTGNKKKNVGNEDSSEDESASSRVTNGGTLVIAPASVMGQWENEIKSKVDRGLLSCAIYHGPTRKKSRNLSSSDIIVTTYATVQREAEDSPLMNIRWSRIILDEAHTIRNAKCKTAKAIFLLKAKTRWALTGTPVQNKEIDLYSLLRFLRCKPFDDLAVWKRWVDNKDTAGIQRLNCILKAILLRRTKEGIQAEGGLKSLQTKTFHNVKVSLNKEEYEIYKKVAYFSRTLLGQLIQKKAEKENLLEYGIAPSNHRYASEENPFKDHPELEALYKDMMSMGNVQTHHILVLLLRLRQICCHPGLAVSVLRSEELNTSGIEDREVDSAVLVDRIHRMSLSKAGQSDVFQKSTCSSKMQAVVEHITNIVFNTEDKLIVVSQWTSVLEIIKIFLDPVGIKYREFHGGIPVKDRPAIIESFNNDTTGPKLMLLSLASGGTGLNLIGANHLLLIDVHWNPQLEAQACDRIYRVGQTKPVHIYKFVCTDTIEENIVQLQEKKLELAKNVLTGSVSNSSSRLTLQDLKMLFNVK